MLRAHSWHSNLTLARASTEAAPTSARAWIRLCGSYFESGGGAVRDNTFLDEAIEACSNGATLAAYALNNPALQLVLKTIRGDITPKRSAAGREGKGGGSRGRSRWWQKNKKK